MDDATRKYSYHQGYEKKLILDTNYKKTPFDIPLKNPVWSMIFSTKFFKNNLKFIGRYLEDRDFVLRSLLRTKKLLINTYLITHFYRINRIDGNSVMQLQVSKSENKIFMLEHLKRVLLEFDLKNTTTSQKDILSDIFLRRFINEIIFEASLWLIKLDQDEIISLNENGLCKVLIKYLDIYCSKIYLLNTYSSLDVSY